VRGAWIAWVPGEEGLEDVKLRHVDYYVQLVPLEDVVGVGFVVRVVGVDEGEDRREGGDEVGYLGEDGGYLLCCAVAYLNLGGRGPLSAISKCVGISVSARFSCLILETSFLRIIPESLGSI
jgi:hypothetical protein